MATVTVSRQKVDSENQLYWEQQEIDESELLPGEFPLPEFLIEPIE